MACVLPYHQLDYENAERRRYPAIFREAPSSRQLGPQPLDEIYRDQLLSLTVDSRYFELEHVYTRLRDQLAALRLLPDGWDGYCAVAPNEVSIDIASRAIDVLRKANADPTAILPAADGGAGICFMKDEHYAHIEFGNSGEAWALMYGPSGPPQTWQLGSTNADAITATWTRINAYLQS